METVFLFYMIFLSLPVSSEPELKINDKAESLARVGFLQFTNIKALNDIGYLSGSISDALAKSMEAKFRYAPIENTNMEISFGKIIEVRKKNVNQGSISIESMPLQIDELINIAKEAKADILIYGQFEPVGNNEAVNITTRIFFAATKAVTDFNPEQHPIDSSLFGSIDIMAKSIVSKIAEAFSEKPKDGAPQKTEKDTKIAQTDTKSDEKITLTTVKLSENTQKLRLALKKKNEISLMMVRGFNKILPGIPGPSGTYQSDGGQIIEFGLHYSRYFDDNNLFAIGISLVFGSYYISDYEYRLSTDNNYKNTIWYSRSLSGVQTRISLSFHPFLGFVVESGVLIGPFIFQRTIDQYLKSNIYYDRKNIFAFGATAAIGYNFVFWNWLVVRPTVGIDYLVGYNVWPQVSINLGVQF